MRISNKIMALVAAVVGIVAMASCNSNGNNGYFVTQTLPSCINTVVTDPDGTPQMQAGVSYTLTFNYTDATVDIKVLNFKDANGTQYPEITLAGLKWDVTYTGWKTISATDIQSSTSSGASGPLFSKFSMKILDRAVNGYQIVPLMEAAYTINSLNYVSTLSSFVNQGTTVCYNLDGSTYTPEADALPIYAITLDAEKGVASIDITNAMFDTMMNRVAMSIRDIPFRVVSPGKYAIDAEGPISAYVGQAANSLVLSEDTKFSNIACSFDGLDNLNLTFNITTPGFSSETISARVIVSSKQPS